MIPFELYSITPDINEFGHIFRIPNYFDSSELSEYHTLIRLQEAKQPRISPENFPNLRLVDFISPSEKTQWFFDNWDKVCELTECDGMTKDDYYYNMVASSPVSIDSSIRGNAPMSDLYPSHTDMGSRKLLTILVPLSHMGDPTMFHGKGVLGNTGSSPRSRVWCHEWALNDAYMFRPSERSYHSYQNTRDYNRWIMNINVCSNRIPMHFQWY